MSCCCRNKLQPPNSCVTKRQAARPNTVGKTAAEVAGIETTVNDSGHNVTTDETLLASCTMDVSGMIAVIALAANYAR